jgi:hypothetical protein
MRGCSASSAATSLATGIAGPADGAVGGQHELLVGRCGELFGARVDLAGQRLLRGGLQRLGVGAGLRRIGAKVNPSSRPITWPSTITSPVLPISVFSIVFSRRRRINTLVRRSTKRSVSRSCSASDNLFSTSRVMPCQCSGSAASPGGWRRRSRCGSARSGPTACRYRRRCGRPGRPGAANQASGMRPLPHQEAEERGHQLGMRGRRDLAVVRDLAGVPQPLDRRRAMRHVAHLVVARGVIEHAHVLGDRRAGQRLMSASAPATPAARRARKKSSFEVAPLQHLDGRRCGSAAR